MGGHSIEAVRLLCLQLGLLLSKLVEKGEQGSPNIQKFYGDRSKLPPPCEYTDSQGNLGVHRADWLQKSEEDMLDSFKHLTDLEAYGQTKENQQRQLFGLTRRKAAHCSYKSQSHYHFCIFEKTFSDRNYRIRMFFYFSGKIQLLTA